MDTVDEPVRRWGQKPGVCCGGAIGEEGRKGLLSLSFTKRESSESWVEVLRDWVKRGLPPPLTMPTDGAVGLPKALDPRWPKSLRSRWWVHKLQHLEQKGPAPAWPAFQALGADRREAPSRQQAEEGRDQLVAL